MKALPMKHHLFIGTNLLLSLIFILTACAANAEGSTSSAPVHSTPTHHNPTPPTTAASGPSSSPTPVATAPILLGTQTCPSGFSSPSHWDTIVGTQNGTSRVESVSCATLIGLSTLQALVTVRFDGTGALLSLYVYTNITSANPTQLLILQGLYKGDAKISAYNTIITGEVDGASSINNNQPNVSLVQDLFREFKWSTSTNTFVQTSFPGIFPDLTRFQAEKDQAMESALYNNPWTILDDSAVSFRPKPCNRKSGRTILIALRIPSMTRMLVLRLQIEPTPTYIPAVNLLSYILIWRT